MTFEEFIEAIREDLLIIGKKYSEETFGDTDYKKKVDNVLSVLSAKHLRIIKLRYGFGGECFTLDEVATDFGTTREFARQLEAKALHTLSKPNLSKELRNLLPKED